MTCRLQRAWVSHHWARRSYRPTRFSRQTPLGHSKTPFPCIRIGGATTGAARPSDEPGLLFSPLRGFGGAPQDRPSGGIAEYGVQHGRQRAGLFHPQRPLQNSNRTGRQAVCRPLLCGNTTPPAFWRSLVGTATSGQNGDRVSGLLPGNGCAVDARFRVIGLLAKNKTEVVSCFA